MNKLQNLIEEIAEKYTRSEEREVERFSDLTASEQTLLLAAVVEDNPDCEFYFYDELCEIELRQKLAEFMRADDADTNAAHELKNYLKKLITKTSTKYIDQNLEKAFDKREREYFGNNFR